jgi:hypothetical protein
MGIKRGRRQGFRLEGTKRLHREIVEMYDRIYQEKFAADPDVAIHLDKTYYAERVKERLNLTYTIEYIRRVVGNSRKRK